MNPGYRDAYLHKGSALAELGSKEEAIEAFDQAIKMNPGDNRVYYRKGLALHRLGILEAMHKAEEQAEKIYPDYRRAIKRKKSLDEDYYKKILSEGLGPAINVYNQSVKTFLRDSCILKEAIEAFDQVISMNPGYRDAYLHKGSALARLGSKEEAIEAFDQAIKMNPEGWEAYAEKSQVLISLGRKEEAEKVQQARMIHQSKGKR